MKYQNEEIESLRNSRQVQIPKLSSETATRTKSRVRSSIEKEDKKFRLEEYPKLEPKRSLPPKQKSSHEKNQ